MHRLAPSLPILWAPAGCTFIFGGPDLSNVPRPEQVDTGLRVLDTDTDTEPIDDTGDDGPPADDGVAPIVLSLDPMPFVDMLGFAFVVADSDNDLVGGTVELTDGESAHLMSIPTELVRFDADGESTAAIDAAGLFDCDLPYTGQWSIVVTDFGGRSSEPYEAEVSLVTRGMLPETTGAYDLGVVSPPTMFCVTYEATYQDPETVRFQVPASGSYSFQFGWPGYTLDADMWLYEVGAPGAPALASSAQVNDDYEGFTVDLVAGTTYRLDLLLYVVNGNPPWEARVVIRPN